ncbi:MAG: NFACT family protein [Defluviitaleaceae bacterium]|nr:NFACT family protein [Defluviitaleaceae bacterium]
MPFDGATLAGIRAELSVLEGGRIDKITQPERDEIFLSVRARGENFKVLLTANANAPRVCFTTQSKISPLSAPMFCMILRKHLGGGRISRIVQPDFDRILDIYVDTLDEMGDPAEKVLSVEIMGKHSNILLRDGERIIDAIKHVPFSVSAVRQILPNAPYSRPPSEGKIDPLHATAELSRRVSLADSYFSAANDILQRAIYMRFNGISPVFSAEICNRAEVDPEKPAATLNDAEKTRLCETFCDIFGKIARGEFECAIYRARQARNGFRGHVAEPTHALEAGNEAGNEAENEAGKIVDLAVLPFTIFSHHHAEAFESPSAMLEAFYAKRDESYRIAQKTADLRKLITAHLERCRKKSFVHEKTLAEVKNRDDLRIKGELLTAYLYKIPPGAASFTAENFYDENAELEITLDPAITAAENAQKYFKKYNKQKRAFTALQEQIEKNAEDLTYLESVVASMDAAENEADIAEIRTELAEQGFAKRKHAPGKNKKVQAASKPLKFTSADGFEIYVGKNNSQNDYLTLRFAKPHDIWFHTKEIAGSHVILVTNDNEPSDAAIIEAAKIAAAHSRAKDGSNVPVDYVARKHVKKPAGAKPGYVIYDKHKTVYVTP